MTKTITNTGRFAGGYFVINKAPVQLSYTQSERFFVTCKNIKGLLNEILRLISEAKYYIKVCSFIIDNQQVVESLKIKLKEGNVSIFILTAVDDKNIKSDMLDEEENEEFSKSRHFEFIDELVKVGAHVRASSNAHAKFITADGTTALLMSANLTEPSLNNNDKNKDPNDESGIQITDKVEVNTLERLFDSIFLYGTEFRKFINLADQTQLISKNENEITLHDFPVNTGNLIWSYETFHKLIYERIIDSVLLANKSIKLSTYSVVELNNLSELIDCLKIFKSKKNTSVRIFCRAMNHRPDHLLACKILAEMGIEICGDMFNHSKGISIDDNHGIIFTANIDGKHGLKNGFEIGYVIDESNNSFYAFNNFLEYQINSAPFVFVLSPAKGDLFDFYNYWYKMKNTKIITSLPDTIDIKIRSNSQFAKEFEENINAFPVFYTITNRNNKKEVQFKIDGKAYLLEVINEYTLHVKKKLDRHEIIKVDEYMFFYNKINLIEYES